MKYAKGIKEDGIVIGNHFDKYGSSNPIVRRIMSGFENSLNELVYQINTNEIHEIGCGEGHWTIYFHQQGFKIRGSDFSKKVIDIARENAEQQQINEDLFSVKNIYDLSTDQDQAKLILCCEVLEHLDDPEKAMAILYEVACPNIILSVPNEPIWSVLNMVRGKYWKDLGNTPGHINRWSTKAFTDLVSSYFNIQRVLTPLPWTMIWAKRDLSK